MSFAQPPLIYNQHGSIRHVGVELEYTHVEPLMVVRDIQKLWGGRHHEVNSHVHKIKDTELGDFTVELDSILLSSGKYTEFLQKMGVDGDTLILGDDLEALLANVASVLVPYELVTPPLPMDQLHHAETLRECLRQRGALGTRSAWRFAFGLHFNPEVPSFEVSSILAHLQAFCVLYPWIFRESAIDYTRRISPYIDEFPAEYLKLILQPEYAPDMGQLIEHYLEHNPTRNRPLDMLPLFSHIAPDLVDRYPIESELNKSRPTFHYRLPNSLVDEEDWHIAHPWRYWVEVEKLAANSHVLHAMSQELLELLHSPLSIISWQWPGKVEGWLQ